MKKKPKSNRERIAVMLADGKPISEIAATLGISRQAVHAQSKPQEPRQCKCGSCGLTIDIGSVRQYAPNCPNQGKKRYCRCGCGNVISTPYAHYLDGHKPLQVRHCHCGCGAEVLGKRQRFVDGHKPKRK